jgi:hypothetical protein
MLHVQNAVPIRTKNSFQHLQRQILLKASIHLHVHQEIAVQIIPAAAVLRECADLINLTTSVKTQFLATYLQFEETGFIYKRILND